MGVFSFFKKKKEEVPEFNQPEEPDFRGDVFQQQPLGGPDFPKFQPDFPAGVSPRDIELVLSKLEIINRKLDDIDKRVQYIERVAKESQ